MTTTINASTSSGLINTADTSGALALQANGTTKLTVDSTGAYGQLVSGTAVASTSGTSIDFTSLPTWIKRITVIFSGTSLSGSANYLIQIGSGSVTSSGYLSYCTYQGAAFTGGNYTSTAGFILAAAGASNIHYGAAVIYLLGSNTWVSNHTLALNASGTGYSMTGGGNSSALSGVLDRVRITTTNGTDTFDAGSINIMYEG
jgi:hypothetical protein